MKGKAMVLITLAILYYILGGFGVTQNSSSAQEELGENDGIHLNDKFISLISTNPLVWALFKRNSYTVFLVPIVYQNDGEFYVPDFEIDTRLIEINESNHYGKFNRFIPEILLHKMIERWEIWEAEEPTERFFFVYPDI